MIRDWPNGTPSGVLFLAKGRISGHLYLRQLRIHYSLRPQPTLTLVQLRLIIQDDLETLYGLSYSFQMS